MSDIGNGHGSSHNWKNKGTKQSHYLHNRVTTYICTSCNVGFHHYYHFEPDIFEAMKSFHVPDVCSKKQTVCTESGVVFCKDGKVNDFI